MSILSPLGRMNKLDPLRLLQFFWRVGGLDAAERLRNRLPRPYWVSRRLFGAQFAVDASASVTQSLLYLWGERLIVERRLVSSLLSPGMHGVDVGANVGYYLLLMQRSIGSKGLITLIEPSPENLPALERNISLNEYSNVEILPVAVGESEGRVGLRSGINSGVTQIEVGDYEVEMRPLDSLLKGRIDFLKIDVEGFEGHVLRGARRLLQRDHPVLFLELHPRILLQNRESVRDIVAEVRDIYSGSVEFYRDITRDLPPLLRLAAQYQLINPVRRFDDLFQSIANLPEDEIGTIWCVAGRRR